MACNKRSSHNKNKSRTRISLRAKIGLSRAVLTLELLYLLWNRIEAHRTMKVAESERKKRRNEVGSHQILCWVLTTISRRAC